MDMPSYPYQCAVCDKDIEGYVDPTYTPTGGWQHMEDKTRLCNGQAISQKANS